MVQKKLKEGPARVTFCPTLACTTPAGVKYNNNNGDGNGNDGDRDEDNGIGGDEDKSTINNGEMTAMATMNRDGGGDDDGSDNNYITINYW